MLLPVAPRAALHVKGRVVVAMVAAAVVAAAAAVIAKPVRCIPLPAQVVARRPRYHSSREKTGLSIAAIVTSHKAPVDQVIAAVVIVALAINSDS
jgi:hypothetical protein